MRKQEGGVWMEFTRVLKLFSGQTLHFTLKIFVPQQFYIYGTSKILSILRNKYPWMLKNLQFN